MKVIKATLLMLCAALAMTAQAYDWAFPWVANQDGRWASQIVVSNHSGEAANVVLTAVRAAGAEGTATQTVEVEVPGHGSLAWTAANLFTEMGSGTGYAVMMSSDEPNISGRYLVLSQYAANANSPSAGEAIPVSSATHMFAASFMSANPDAFSAIVAVNPTDTDAAVDVSATMVMNNKSRVLEKMSVTIPAGRPFILNAAELFAGEMGSLNVMVDSSQPLVANVFFFNSAGEPGIANVTDLATAGPRIAAPTDDSYHAAPADQVALGKALFWDKILSGNMNIACATCHHGLAGTGDGLSLPVGAGGSGLGVARSTANPDVVERVPRNAPHIFNSGAKEFNFMFHDGRVAISDPYFISPAGDELLPGLDNILAAQAMFPVTSNAEMAGLPGSNSIADSANNTELWSRLVERLMGVQEYQDMFSAAFPDITVPDDVTFAHAANAIAAYENATFRADQSPFDGYLRGNKSALNKQEQRGMALFYGKADCASCHSGAFQTDMEFHAIAMPPVGPGKGDGFMTHDDFGRARETGDDADRYKFRTPSLRNVALTAPYGHSGAYDTLESVVRHHLNPAAALAAYNKSEAVLISREDLNATDWLVYDDQATLDAIAAASEIDSVDLNDAEVADLVAFLHALTDKRFLDMRSTIPRTVPSGLPVGD